MGTHALMHLTTPSPIPSPDTCFPAFTQHLFPCLFPPPLPHLRLRTPNDWESLLHWQDVLVWRNQIYNIVINAFRNMAEIAPQLHQLGYKDKVRHERRGEGGRGGGSVRA